MLSTGMVGKLGSSLASCTAGSCCSGEAVPNMTRVHCEAHVDMDYAADSSSDDGGIAGSNEEYGNDSAVPTVSMVLGGEAAADMWSAWSKEEPDSANQYLVTRMANNLSVEQVMRTRASMMDEFVSTEYSKAPIPSTPAQAPGTKSTDTCDTTQASVKGKR